MNTIGWRWSLCENCCRPVAARVHAQDGKIYYSKQCTAQDSCRRKRTVETVISTDEAYFQLSHGPFTANDTRPELEACKQYSALIVELADECNMRCPTCIAADAPGSGNVRPLDVLYRKIAASEERGQTSRILMLSGGEPTIHPKFFEVLTRACESNFGRVFLITNGLRIANEPSFVAKLRDFRNKLEIYLQFDSLRPNVLKEIRGEDLSSIRRTAVGALNSAGIPMSLVCVVKRGLNDDDLGNVVTYASNFEFVRGITLQPIKVTGRNETLNVERDLIALTDVRKILMKELGCADENAITPHPVNTENMAIGYFQRKNGKMVPVTQAVLKGHDENGVRHAMYFLPQHNTNRYSYDNLFRVAIVSFMDKFNFSFELVPSSIVGFTTEQGFKIPLDVFYLKKELGHFPGIAKVGNNGKKERERAGAKGTISRKVKRT